MLHSRPRHHRTRIHRPSTAADSSGRLRLRLRAQPSSANQDKKDSGASDQGKNSGTSNDRLFYTLPNFLSLENAGKLPPLTAKQKFAVVARGTFDYVQFPWWGLLAAINQADNAEPAYGQGFEGYAKRYGTTAADGIIENFMTAAVLPSLLHQDPRFYQSGKGGFARRSGYAISRIFVTRSDSGHSQFNYSEIFGSAAAATISTYSYHPRSTYLSTPTNPHMFIRFRSDPGEHGQSVGNAGRPRHFHHLAKGILAGHPPQTFTQTKGGFERHRSLGQDATRPGDPPGRMPWSRKVSYAIRLGSIRRSTTNSGCRRRKVSATWQFQQTGWYVEKISGSCSGRNCFHSAVLKSGPIKAGA